MDPSLATIEEQEEAQQAAAATSAFIKWDKDQSGGISLDELPGLASHMGLPIEEGELEQVHAMLDLDSNGNIELEEWVKWWLKRAKGNPSPEKQQEVVARNAFSLADKDGSGCLDMSELAVLCDDLGLPLEGDDLVEAMKMLDKDGNNQLDREEFVQWWVDKTDRDGGGRLAKRLRQVVEAGQRRMHTDIHTATWKGDIALVIEFLNVDVRLANAPDNTEFGRGMTPLHYASYQGHLSICQKLVESGAKINTLTDNGCSALFYAAQQGHAHVVEWLLNEGADHTPIETATGFSAVDMAKLYPDILDMMTKKVKCNRPDQPNKPPIIIKHGATYIKVELSSLPKKERDQLPVTQYKVKIVQPMDEGDKVVDLMLVPNTCILADGDKSAAGCSVVVKGLQPSTNYRIAYAAVNSFGFGPYSVFTDLIQTLPEEAISKASQSVSEEQDPAVVKGLSRAQEARDKRQAILKMQKEQQEREKLALEALNRQRKVKMKQAANAFMKTDVAKPTVPKQETESEKAERMQTTVDKAAYKMLKKLRANQKARSPTNTNQGDISVDVNNSVTNSNSAASPIPEVEDKRFKNGRKRSTGASSQPPVDLQNVAKTNNDIVMSNVKHHRVKGVRPGQAVDDVSSDEEAANTSRRRSATRKTRPATLAPVKPAVQNDSSDNVRVPALGINLKAPIAAPGSKSEKLTTLTPMKPMPQSFDTTHAAAAASGGRGLHVHKDKGPATDDVLETSSFGFSAQSMTESSCGEGE